MSNGDLDKLLFLPRGTGFSTWRLLDSSVGIWHYSVPTFGSEIVLSARMSAPSFAGFSRCALLWPRRLLSPLQSSFVVSWWLLLKYLRYVPPPTLPFHLHQSINWLPLTMTNWHTNTATAPLSACQEAPVKTLPIQADLSWSPLPLVPLCTALFSFFLLMLLYPAPILHLLSEPSPAVNWP